MQVAQVPSQKIIEDIVAYSGSDLRIILNMEQFMRYVRETDSNAIDFICRNVKGMLDILFVDYDKLSNEQYEIYSDLISKIWEIIELNIEPILKQIEIFWEIIFDLRWRALVPDAQWGFANKLFSLIKQRDQKFVTDQFQRPNFLVSFIQLMHINSVAQIIIVFYEYDFHPQQIDFLKAGFERFAEFDPCSAINFTFIVHEVMTRIMIEEQVQFLIQGEILTKMFSVIVREDVNAITLKNAAHILSLVSNYYSMDMQNIQLDEPESQQITLEFRSTSFFETFEIATIGSIFKRSLLYKNKLGLLIIKLVEIVDNLVRITDVKFWEKIEKNNIMLLIFDLIHKFHSADIFISYVDNMVAFIFDRALSDFHPYWASKLILKYKIHERHLRSVDRQVYSFEQKLSLKLIKEGDFAPYFDYLKNIEEQLAISTIWRNTKLHLMQQEEIHKNKLGEDPGSPQIEEPIIISAMNVDEERYQEQDNIEETAENIFIRCQSNTIPIRKELSGEEITANIFSTVPMITDSESESESSEQQSENSSGLRHNIWVGNPSSLTHPLEDGLKKLDQIFQAMDIKDTTKHLSQSDSLDEHKKKTRNLSNSLKHEKEKPSSLTSSLKHDHDAPSPGLQRRNSLQSSWNVKNLNKNFEEYHIDFLNDRKILKNDNNNVLKVDEIDLEKEKPLQLLEVVFQKSDNEIILKTKMVDHVQKNIKIDRVEEIKFRKLQDKDKHFLEFLKSQE